MTREQIYLKCMKQAVKICMANKAATTCMVVRTTNKLMDAVYVNAILTLRNGTEKRKNMDAEKPENGESK